MSTVEITKRMEGTSPRIRNKVVAGYYLLSVLAGVSFFFFHGRLGSAAESVTAVFYLAATGLFYGLSGGSGKDRHKGQRGSRDS